MSLRVFACAAPQFVRGAAGDMALSSADPASLFNACRVAALRAETGEGAWADSNWSEGVSARRASTLLLNDLPQLRRAAIRQVLELRPNLALIGAMSICFRGAIETAKMLRICLGDDVLIVLGGRHPTETIYPGAKSQTGHSQIAHHPASPLRLMHEGQIKPLFDVVLSGDGEHFIADLGELLGQHLARPGAVARDAASKLDDLAPSPGRWIAGRVHRGRIETVTGRGPDLDHDRLPTPAQVFGVGTSFDIFAPRPTAHVFSDSGPGCIYDCAFCSERISVTGAPRQRATAAMRLHRQLAIAQSVVREAHPRGPGASAFVEDSTLLSWAPRPVAQFEDEMTRHPLSIPFGGQATVDQILRFPDLAPRLRRLGLHYLFIGLETPEPEAIGGMHKDIGKSGSWLERANRTAEILADADIGLGISLLFGLGERPAARQMLFDTLNDWRRVGLLRSVSMNWAVQHPLRNTVRAPAYTYLDWAIKDGPLLSLLRQFGEASEIYTVQGGQAPDFASVSEIVSSTQSLMAAAA